MVCRPVLRVLSKCATILSQSRVAPNGSGCVFVEAGIAADLSDNSRVTGSCTALASSSSLFTV